MRIGFLRIFLVICAFSFLLNFDCTAQVDPEDPPIDGEELGVPLSGADLFYLVALGLGGILIYGQRRKLKATEKK